MLFISDDLYQKYTGGEHGNLANSHLIQCLDKREDTVRWRSSESKYLKYKTIIKTWIIQIFFVSLRLIKRIWYGRISYSDSGLDNSISCNTQEQQPSWYKQIWKRKNTTLQQTIDYWGKETNKKIERWDLWPFVGAQQISLTVISLF